MRDLTLGALNRGLCYGKTIFKKSESFDQPILNYKVEDKFRFNEFAGLVHA